MKHLSYIIPLALAALFAACSSDDDGFAADTDAVKVEAAVGNGLFSRSNPLGTAEEQTQFNSGDKITVATERQDPVTYTYDGTAWTSAGQLRWTTGAGMTFDARYPEGTGDFTVPADQSSAELIARADFMTCSKSFDATPADRTLSLAMERRMALVRVNIAGFNNLFGETDPKVTALSIRSEHATVSQSGAGSGDATAIAPYRTTGDGGTGTTYVAIVAPRSTSTKMEFIRLTVTYDTDKTVEFIARDSRQLQPGTCYAYDLTVGKNAVAVECTINDWISDGASGSGSVVLSPTKCDEPGAGTTESPRLRTNTANGNNPSVEYNYQYSDKSDPVNSLPVPVPASGE